MAEITETIVAPIWPQTADGKTVFNQKSDALAPQLIDIQDQMNTYATQANALRDEVNGFQQTATAQAVAAANSAVASDDSAALSQEWATITGGLVEATDYSSKEYAIGTTAPLGSSKKWAVELSATVDGVDFSSKEYAIGTTVSTGSAKQWASEDEDSVVSGGLYSSKHYSLKSEGFKDSAEAAAAAAGAAAGLPSLLGNAGRQLTVNSLENGVFWGDAGAQSYTLNVGQSQQVVSGGTGGSYSILSSSNRFVTSEDGVTWSQPTDKFSIELTGDLYVAHGLINYSALNISYPSYTSDYSNVSASGTVVLNGDTYECTANSINRYSGVFSDSVLSQSITSSYSFICTDGTDIIAINGGANDRIDVFAGGDLTATPTQITLPFANVAGTNIVFDGADLWIFEATTNANLYQMDGVSSTVLNTYTTPFSSCYSPFFWGGAIYYQSATFSGDLYSIDISNGVSSFEANISELTYIDSNSRFYLIPSVYNNELYNVYATTESNEGSGVRVTAKLDGKSGAIVFGG